MTPDGCVGSIKDLHITNMFFDEEFYQTGGYTNFLSGETNPNPKCADDFSGAITNMVISGSVAGRPLVRTDFIVDSKTVPGLTFQNVTPSIIPEIA